MSTIRPHFAIGDRVRPRPGWRDLPTDPRARPLPWGAVTSVEPLGLGQWIRVGDDSRPHVSGIFERDEAAS